MEYTGKPERLYAVGKGCGYWFTAKPIKESEEYIRADIVYNIIKKAKEELDWLKKTQEDVQDRCRIIGYEDAYRHFLILSPNIQQSIKE